MLICKKKKEKQEKLVKSGNVVSYLLEVEKIGVIIRPDGNGILYCNLDASTKLSMTHNLQ